MELAIVTFFSLILIFYVLYLLLDAEGEKIRKKKNIDV